MGLLATACCTSLTVQAQPSTLPYADYWRTDGPIRAAADANGILYIGGDFTYVGPASGSAGVWDTATQSARPFPTLQSLNSQVLSVVHTAVSDGAGGWFLGGQFNTAIVGISNLVHVTADGGLDTAFKPNPDQPVRALLLSGNTSMSVATSTISAAPTMPVWPSWTPPRANRSVFACRSMAPSKRSRWTVRPSI